MIQSTVGYPDLINLNQSSMSLETAGIVSTPNFFKGPGLATQKAFFSKGFQGGLGDTNIFDSLDTASAGVGGFSVLTLVGIGFGIYYVSKFFSGDSQRKEIGRNTIGKLKS